MSSLKYIVQSLETICANNLSIKSFEFGSDFDISVGNKLYPQVYAEIQPSTINDKIITISMNIVVSDRLELDNSNELQVLDSMLSIVTDLRAEINAMNSDSIKINESSSIDPFTESSTDITAGWIWGVDFEIIDLKDSCNLPK
jgi:hypothetical protein